MKAVYLTKQGNAQQAFEIRETETPKLKFRDDVLIKVEAFGLKVQLVEGEENSFKITRPVDLVVAERLIGER